MPAWIVYCSINNKNIIEFFYYLSTSAYWFEHYGAWYVALLIPLYAVTPIMAKLIDKSKHRFQTSIFFVIVIVVLSRVPVNVQSLTVFNLLENIQFVLCRVPLYIMGYAIGPCVKEKKQIPWIYVLGLVMIQVIMGKIPIINMVYRSGLLAFALSAGLCMALEKCKIDVVRGVLQWFGDISLESYLANIYIAYLLSLVSWKFGKFDMSKGNYVYYGCVVIIGILIAYYVRLIYDFLWNKILKTCRN